MDVPTWQGVGLDGLSGLFQLYDSMTLGTNLLTNTCQYFIKVTIPVVLSRKAMGSNHVVGLICCMYVRELAEIFKKCLIVAL